MKSYKLGQSKIKTGSAVGIDGGKADSSVKAKKNNIPEGGIETGIAYADQGSIALSGVFLDSVNISGLNKENIQKIVNAVKECFSGSISDIENLFNTFIENKFKALILNVEEYKGKIQLLDNKMNERLDMLLNEAQKYKKKEEDAQNNEFGKIVQELEQYKGDIKGYIQSENEKLAVQIAQSIVRLDQMQSCLEEISNKQSETAEGLAEIKTVSEMTFEEVRNMSEGFALIRQQQEYIIQRINELEKLNDYEQIQHLKNASKNAFDEMSKMVQNMFLRSEKSNQEVYDNIRQMINVQSNYVASIIVNQTAKLDEKVKSLETFVTGINTSINDLNKGLSNLKDELSDNYDQKTNLILSEIKKMTYKSYESDCEFCGVPRAQVTQCLICGNMASSNRPLIRTASTELPYEQCGENDKLLIIHKGDNQGRVYLSSISASCKNREKVKIILVEPSVKSIQVPSLSNANGTKCILSAFSNLKRFALAKPENGAQHYELGEGLFDASCYCATKQVELFGMEYVASVGDGCFSEWFDDTDRDAKAKFVADKRFSIDIINTNKIWR